MKHGILIALAIFLLVNSGCFVLIGGAVGGAGTAVWLSNKLTTELGVPYEKAIDTVEGALKSLNLRVNKKVVKAKVAQIKSEYTDGKVIWIDIRPVSKTVTRVAVRVGALGDEEASRKIMDKILKKS